MTDQWEDAGDMAPRPDILAKIARELAREQVDMDKVEMLREEAGVTQEELEEMFEGGLE